MNARTLVSESRETSGVRRIPALWFCPVTKTVRAPEYGALQTLRAIGTYLLCATVLIATGSSGVCASSAAQRPNILFIMADDHAAHAISSYGSKINQTPNLDRLAKEGMRFQ